MPSDERRGLDRIGVINGLRGAAILGVIYHHLFAKQTPPGYHSFQLGSITVLPYTYFYNFWIGVNLFFVLSGFVLYLPYALNRRTMAGWQDAVQFYKHRAWRLMPLYYFAVVFGMLFLWKHDFLSPRFWKYFCLMATATFNFTLSTFYPWENWVLWSLGLEIWFSVLFPLLLFAIGRWGFERVALAVFALSLAVRFIGLSKGFYIETDHMNWIKDSILGRLDDFVVGMLACRIYVQRPRVGAGLRAGLLVFSFALITLGCYLWDYDYLRLVARPLVPFFNNVLQAGFLALVVSLLFMERGFLRWLFANRMIQVIGMMCYSLYVWHGVVMQSIWSGLPQLDLRLLVYVFMLFLISGLTYRFIEFGRVQDARKLFRASG
jgi:peptidoglycan/LPS O-acetylase OafA/YrhL